MKQVSMYQTEDGKTFPTRLKATEWETVLDIRGILNTANERVATRKDPEEVIVSCCDAVFERLKRFRSSRGSILAAKNRQKNA